MAHTACLVCLIGTVSGQSKKQKMLGASSGHIANIKQSISFRCLWNICVHHAVQAVQQTA
jgi:hypothetical protein